MIDIYSKGVRSLNDAGKGSCVFDRISWSFGKIINDGVIRSDDFYCMIDGFHKYEDVSVYLCGV